jgi:hypothetical protein
VADRAESTRIDWYDARRGADTGRARLLAELARTRLSLALLDHPGIGGHLLTIGLHSPVTRNRNMALNAFQQWPAESWPSEARGFIEARHRPNEQTRELVGRVLRSEPSE